MKTCSKCKENKNLLDFNKSSKNYDGLQSLCKICSRLNNKLHYNDNKLAYKKRIKKYVELNKDQFNEYQRKYKKQRYYSNINSYLRAVLRGRMFSALKKNTKSGSTIIDLGCTIEELKLHLEKQFQSGMTWENKGKWHIDHIIPLSNFDLSIREQFLNACHYTNLQPLWAKDNMKKSNKLQKADEAAKVKTEVTDESLTIVKGEV